MFREFAEFGSYSPRSCKDGHFPAIFNELPEGIGKVTIPAPEDEGFDAVRGIIDEHVPADFHVKIALPLFQVRPSPPVELPELVVEVFDGFKPERP